MARIRAGEIEIEVECIGDADAPPLLLIAGLGSPLLRWDEVFCRAMADRGFRAIRFDNRDVGLSSKLDAAGAPDVAAALRTLAGGGSFEPPYRLEDMVDDGFALLDGLGVEAAHVVGLSMGGMLAQLMALGRPGRVRTLTSLMSTSGARDLPLPTPAAIAHMLETEPGERDANVAHHVRGARLLGGSLPFDEAWTRRREQRIYDRCFHPPGRQRQMLASIAAGSRREALASLRVPTLVIHGSEDPLVPPECGIDVAKAVPGARLRIVEGMGHDLRPCLWSTLADAIAEHARAA